MLTSEHPTPSPFVPPTYPSDGGADSPSHSTSNLSCASHGHERSDPPLSFPQSEQPSVRLRERTPPSHKPHPSDQTVTASVSSSQDSGIESNTAENIKRQSGHFLKMKNKLEKRMGVDKDEMSNEEDNVTPPSPVTMRPKGPPPVPKRSTSTVLSNAIETDHTATTTTSDATDGNV